MSAVAVALRQAARFDRSAVSLWAGAVAAVPVVVVLAGGTLAGHTVAAVTMGAGAMLVGIAWRAGGGLPPVATMVTDTAVMGLSTFAGAATGRVPWLHISLLVVWSFAAGLIVAAGRRSAVVGTQAIIAFVVFGRFSQPIPGAAELAGLVLAGGSVQVLFSALLGAPPALRAQRHAVAEAYRLLAEAATDPDARAGAAASALDEAERKLASPTLLGDPAAMPLGALVQEARRMRIEFAALSLLLSQHLRRHPAAGAAQRPVADRVRERTADALRCIAAVLEGDAAPDRLEPALRALDAAVAELTATARAPGPRADGPNEQGSQLAPPIAAHAAALAGQVRAAARIVAGVHERRGRIAMRPSLGSPSRWEQLAADLAQIRANASLDSPAGRHAVRLAVIVPLTELLAQLLQLQRSYWAVVAAATVLRPDFSGTVTRGAERMAGTLAGVVLAGLVSVTLHPSGWATVALVGVLAWAAYSVFAASFTAGITFLTAMIVFLLEAVAPGTLATATDRGIDTIVGGAIGLLAYALWPTWSSTSAPQALADLVTAQREYVRAVLGAVADGGAPDEEQLRRLARQARLAWTNAEATIERSLTEPSARRIDVERARRMMTGLRRIVQAGHVIRLELERGESPPRPELRPLASALDRALELIAEAIASGAPVGAGVPPLRELYGDLVSARTVATSDGAGAALDPVLVTELDEMVDAANSIAGELRVGPAPAGAARRARPARAARLASGPEPQRPPE